MWFKKKNNRQYQTLSDEELCKKIRLSDSNSLRTELYYRYSHLVLGVCIKYLKNKLDAEDLTIDVFTRLSHKIQKSEIKNFKSWLYTLVRNECLMLLRKKKQTFSDLQEELISLDIFYEPKNDERDLFIDQLSTCIENLNENQRICIDLFYFKKLSYSEIALKTGHDINRIKSHLQNAKRNLKISLLKMKNHES